MVFIIIVMAIVVLYFIGSKYTNGSSTNKIMDKKESKSKIKNEPTDEIFIIDYVYCIGNDQRLENVEVKFYKDDRHITIDGEKYLIDFYSLEERGLSKGRRYYKIADRHYLFWVSKKDYKRFKKALNNIHIVEEIQAEKEHEKVRQRNKINLETSFEYDPIDEDIYKCFIAYKLDYERRDGTLKQFHKIEDKISEVCKEHGGRYFKTAAKTAKFAIIFDDKAMFYTYIKELRDKEYKVTSFDKALEYFGIADMWDIKALYELRNEYINYMRSDC